MLPPHRSISVISPKHNAFIPFIEINDQANTIVIDIHLHPRLDIILNQSAYYLQKNTWINMINVASAKQIMVLAVNIDSPSKNQVNMGNKIIPVDEPINLAVQTEPVALSLIHI